MPDVSFDSEMTMAGGERTLLAGRYRIVRQLGQGGMGSVWLAEDTQLDDKLFAIKMLPSILIANKRAFAQLKAEALTAMKLAHPNIVTLRAFDENKGNPFLVMDYVEGKTLEDCLSETGSMSEAELALLVPIAEAIDYAHRQGVVHRDIKPSNIMIRTDGTPFILDFGIAREVKDTMTRVTGKLSSGTLLYMSPEQLNGDAPSPAQDVYSFAAMLYECLKGDPPFVRGAVEDQIKHKEPEPLPPEIGIASSIMRGLAKTPEERPSTCMEVLCELHQFKAEAQETFEPIVENPRRKKKWGVWFHILWILLFLATLGSIGGMCYEMYLRNEDANRRIVELQRKEAKRQEEARKAEEKRIRDEQKQLGSEAKRQKEETERKELEKRLAELQAELKRIEQERQLAQQIEKEETITAQPMITYTVKRGDTLAGIAYGHRIKISELKRLNGLTDLPIRVGQTLKIPVVANKETTSTLDGQKTDSEHKGGDTKTITLPGGAKMEMIYCEPGEFMMGSDNYDDGADDDEKTASGKHRVRITKGFWLGKCEVSQKQWQSVMGDNPSHFKGLDRPVEKVSWEDCQSFIQKVNDAATRQLGGEARLPTEAEWEYACRAGTTTVLPILGIGDYDSLCFDDFDSIAWFAGNSKSATHIVGQKNPNPWGFYDMIGNVWEWCNDWYGSEYYKDSPIEDPKGPDISGCHVMRGSGWRDFGQRYIRSAVRKGSVPGSDVGFRLCCSAEPIKENDVRNGRSDF